MSDVKAQRGIVFTLSIPNNTKPSNAAIIGYQADRVVNVAIWSPATLTGTVNVQTSPDNSTWSNLELDGGSDVAIAASKALVLRGIVAKYLRLNSGTNEGAQRDFQVIVLNAFTPV